MVATEPFRDRLLAAPETFSSGLLIGHPLLVVALLLLEMLAAQPPLVGLVLAFGA